MAGPATKEEEIQFIPLLKSSRAFRTGAWRNRFSPYKFFLFLHDIAGVLLGFGVGVWISDLGPFLEKDLSQLLIVALLSLVGVAFFQENKLYSYHRIFSAKIHLANIVKSFLWGLFSLSLVVFIHRSPDFVQGQALIIMGLLGGIGLMLLGRYFSNHFLTIILATGISFLCIGLIELTLEEGQEAILLKGWFTLLFCFSLSVGFILASRYVLVQLVFNGLLRKWFRRQVVIVGSDKEAETITNHVIEHNAPFWVSGFVGTGGGGDLHLKVCKGQLCELKDLPSIVEERGISEILVTDEGMDKRVLVSLLDYCTTEGITIWFPPKLMPVIDLKLYVDDFCGIPMIRLCSQKFGWLFDKIKHSMDAIITLPVVVALSPVLLLIAAAIKVSSRGPAFYRARAVGRNGKEFTMYKFRSMSVNNGNGIHKDFVTRLIKGEIRKEDQKDGILKITDDPRVTAVGRILRRYSLDELPQLFNVLKGDMSLVGPRPCLPYEYEVYKDWHKKRLSVRPGITCLWQVVGRSDVTFEEIVLLDLYYIYNRSFLMDLNILYETMFAVLAKRGAY